MSDKKASPLFGIGSITLLTVLLVLGLTIFAVLALSSAQADLRLSQKTAQAASDYYQLDSTANQIMATATASWEEGLKPDALSLEASLQDMYGENIYISDYEQGLAIYADLPLNDTQHLQLDIVLLPPGQENRWQIFQWQMVSEAGEVIIFDALPVWTEELGEEIPVL